MDKDILKRIEKIEKDIEMINEIITSMNKTNQNTVKILHILVGIYLKE